MSFLPEYELKKCVNRYNGNFHSIKFTCRDQFMVMSFVQFTDRSGLISDQAIMLTVYKLSRFYPDRIRIVVYEDFENGTGTVGLQTITGNGVTHGGSGLGCSPCFS